MKEVHINIPEEYVAGEALTPTHILAKRKESFKLYKENIVKTIEVCWNFIILSAGVFGVITAKTNLFDTSEWVQHYLIAYLLLGFFAVTISRVIDQNQHFASMKYLVTICLCAVLGYAATGVLHLKAPKWEWFLGLVTVATGVGIFCYLRQLRYEGSLAVLTNIRSWTTNTHDCNFVRLVSSATLSRLCKKVPILKSHMLR